MGQPVVHFEVVGKDGEALRSFYSELFEWKIDAKAESLGGTRLMGPDEVMEGLSIAQFADPEGHVIGLVKTG